MSTGKSALQQTLRGRSGCYISLACSIGSISVACGSLFQIPNSSDRISLQRGLLLTSLGLIYFVSLTDFCNKYLIETAHGKRFRQKYHLMISDVMEITNRIVSTIQAAFSFFVGLIVCKATCSKSFVYASHFLMEAYGWFGTAYFLYDLWAMYEVDCQKIADKLKLVGTKKQKNGKSANNGHSNGLYDKKKCDEHGDTNDDGTNLLLTNGNGKQQAADHLRQLETDNSDYDEECIEIPKDKRLSFFKYLIANPLMMIHHVFIGTFGLLVVTYIRGGGHCIYSYIYMMEFSTPFVSLRSVLSTLGLKESRAYVINGILMLVTFFICRIYMWPHVFWHYSAAINTTMWQAFMGLPRGCYIGISILLFPQIYWFYLMVKGAAKVLLPGKSSVKPVQQSANKNLSSTSEISGLLPVSAAKQSNQVSMNGVIGEKVIEKVLEGISPLLDPNGKL